MRDAVECSVLVLLDLSAAFDTVDHHILIERLRWVCLDRLSIVFSRTCQDRIFSVTVHNYASSTESLFCGDPQGFVPRSMLFALYSLPLGQIIRDFKGISFHC